MQRQNTTRRRPGEVERVCRTCGVTFFVAASQLKHRKAAFCRKSCVVLPNERRSYTERFWERVDKDGPIPEHRPDLGHCWVWTARRIAWGYGGFWVNRRNMAAHRFSWELHNGPIPEGLWVLHACDNPPCIRPDHLFLGTVIDNNLDKLRKGRQAKGETHGAYTKPERRVRQTGSQHGRAKLDEIKVTEILRRYSTGDVTQKELAVAYGVTPTAIRKVVKRIGWLHVQ